MKHFKIQRSSQIRVAWSPSALKSQLTLKYKFREVEEAPSTFPIIVWMSVFHHTRTITTETMRIIVRETHLRILKPSTCFRKVLVVLSLTIRSGREAVSLLVEGHRARCRIRISWSGSFPRLKHRYHMSGLAAP